MELPGHTSAGIGLGLPGEGSRPDGAGRTPIAPTAPSTAELAECTCPEFCERDHANE